MRAVGLLGAALFWCLLPWAVATHAAPGDGDAPARTLDLTRMTYVGSSDEVREVVLGAEHARVLPEREQVLLAQVDLSLAGAQKGALELTCDHGELDLANGNFIGIGNVRGKTPDGRRFETDRLVYDHELGLVSSDASVVIRDGTAAIRGGGLSYQVREGRLHLLGGASVVQSK
jgi:LPS export ABC transporter protein LptC